MLFQIGGVTRFDIAKPSTINARVWQQGQNIQIWLKKQRWQFGMGSQLAAW
jgi:hypothetical protein